MKIFIFSCLSFLLMTTQVNQAKAELIVESKIGSILKTPLVSSNIVYLPSLDKTPFGFGLSLTLSNQGLHITPEILLNVLKFDNFKLFFIMGVMFHINNNGYTVSNFKRTHDYTFSIKGDITLRKNISLLVSGMFNLPDPVRLFNYGDYARAINETTYLEGGSLWLGVSYKF